MPFFSIRFIVYIIISIVVSNLLDQWAATVYGHSLLRASLIGLLCGYLAGSLAYRHDHPNH
jgi:ABC-type enterochelin transport system permease subunit